MRIGIIVNGNEIIGLGHIIRCKAIAEYLKTIADNVSFILPDTVDKSLIKGFDTISIPIGEWLNNTKTEVYFHKLLKNFDGLLLDLVEKEYVKFSFLEKLPIYIVSLTLFDFNRENYFGNISFFPTLTKFNYKANHTEIYAGPEYFIICDKIRKVERDISDINPVPVILITMGGADPYDITTKVIQSTDLFDFEFQAIVIGGKANRNKERIKSIVESRSNFAYHDFVDNIEEIYSKIDFAIINGGNTRYELTFLRIPYACISIHETQFEINENVTGLFGGLNLGIYNKISEEYIAREIQKTIKSPQKIQTIFKEMKKFKGGDGHEIIGNTIIQNIQKKSIYEKDD